MHIALLASCQAALAGTFPLNGTYFQVCFASLHTGGLSCHVMSCHVMSCLCSCTHTITISSLSAISAMQVNERFMIHNGGSLKAMQVCLASGIGTWPCCLYVLWSAHSAFALQM